MLAQSFFNSHEWHFERHFKDLLTGQSLQGKGTASISIDAYDERGWWQMHPQEPLYFDQQYKFSWDKPGVLGVQFSDGRHLININLQTRYTRDNHYCGNDHYKMVFKLTLNNQFLVTWRVKGPAKNYILKTSYYH